MMIGKFAFAAGLFVASSLGGVALGSYTIGGFHIHDPPDIIGSLAAAEASDEAPPPLATVPAIDVAHVCKGCDAKLYHEQEWRYDEPAYEEAASYEGSSYEGYSKPEDLMPSEEKLPRAAAAVQETPMVVRVADAAQSSPDMAVPEQVSFAHAF